MVLDNISVFYASDENYAMPLAVSMASVIVNTKSYINFYILENNISDESKKNIENIKKKYSNFSVKYITVDINLFNNFPNISWYSLNMYSRFLISEIEPDLDKAIYLDVDIIVKSDIKKLFEIDLQNHPLGAVAGEEYYLRQPAFKNHISKLGLSKKHTYFGSGVLIIDAGKWREQNLFEKVMKTVEEKKELLKYPDQDALNIVFDNNYKKIDLYWNRDIACLEKEYKNDSDAVNKCFLIHYDGKEKPWNSDNVFASIYWHKYKELVFSKETCNRQNLYLYDIDLNNKNLSATVLYDFIKANSTILDIGCACGGLSKLLYENKKCDCYGIEYNPESIEAAKQLNIFSEIENIDLNTFNKDKYKKYFNKFDYIILGDVLEHLVSPENLLIQLKNFLKYNGKILVSLPNIAHASIKSAILFDDWSYTDTGVLDRSHLRYFTSKNIPEFFSTLHFKIEDLDFVFMQNTGMLPYNYWFKLPFYVKNFITKDFYSSVWQFVLCLSIDEMNSKKVICGINKNYFKNKYNDKYNKYSYVKKVSLKNEFMNTKNLMMFVFFKYIVKNKKKCNKYRIKLGI